MSPKCKENLKVSLEKARVLTSEFSGTFPHVHSTFQPANLESETAGKSSNTRWAANHLCDEVMPAQGLDISRCVFTVADADSEFRSKRFAALTYHFLHAGGVEGEPPQRYMPIWQPPVLHYKNIITQPAIVRLCSLVTSQHELANLADPNATRISYSTYSMSAQLAQQARLQSYIIAGLVFPSSACRRSFFAFVGQALQRDQASRGSFVHHGGIQVEAL